MNENRLTLEDISKIMNLNSIDNCKQYLKIMLDFYFDIITSPQGQESSSHEEECRNLWIQTVFSKGCQFYSLLDGVGYSKGDKHLNPIIDFSILFTIARSIYESLIAFEILFVLPKSEEQQTIIFNLFMAQGLSERLKDLSEEARIQNLERIKSEQNSIEECKKAIEGTSLYQSLDQQTKNVLQNALGKRFRYHFKKDNTLEFVNYEKAYEWLNVKENIFESIYSFFSLHGHPSYLSLIQFRDAFNDECRADISLATHAAQCVLSFMSFFIVDFMKLNPKVKTTYDILEQPRKFVIGMYEDTMRGENKFTIIED